MWSDNEATIDLLGFQHLASGVLGIVRRDDLLPATIGVFGDWGSGKSSLLQLVRVELESNKDILVLPFNGWLFEGQEDAKTALMGTILEEIGNRKGLPRKALELVGKLLNRVNVMRVMMAGGRAALAYLMGGPVALGLSAGVDLATTVSELEQKASEVDLEKAEKMIKDAPTESSRRSIREFRADFEELLKQANIKTLVVIIDDLDRCTPDTIIETLEAIKLFLFVPKTAFILGADERLVKYAVRRRFPELPGERAEVGRDYLEKLVQFPVRVPPLSRSEIETYINLLFARRAGLDSDEFEKARRRVVDCDPAALLSVRFNFGVAKEVLKNVPSDLEDNLAMAQRIAPVLATGMSGNPRQCKRFLNMLVMRSEMAASRKVTLQQRTLAKLMLLEYFRPETFRRLAELQGAQQGKPVELLRAEQAVRARTDAIGPGPGDTRRTPAEQSAERPAERITDSADIAAWLADDWIREWLESEPALSDTDLHPYFFFSRDALGPLGGAVQRMSPAAQEKLTALFHESEAVRQNAIKQAKELSPTDAAAVFESLGERARREDDPSVPTSALFRICEWTGARTELLGQFVTFLASLPETSLPIAVVPRLLALGNLGPEQDKLVRQLVEKWAKVSQNLRLRTAAGRHLKSRAQG